MNRSITHIMGRRLFRLSIALAGLFGVAAPSAARLPANAPALPGPASQGYAVVLVATAQELVDAVDSLVDGQATVNQVTLLPDTSEGFDAHDRPVGAGQADIGAAEYGATAAWENVATVTANTGTSQGVAWCDYDGDGDLDIYVANYALGETCALYRNDGVSGFVEVVSSTLAIGPGGRAVAWSDYDNDGNLDLFLGRYGGTSCKLFRGNGDGTFTDVTVSPLDNSDWISTVAWGDYDNDGLVDLYLASTSTSNKLLRNEGGGMFSDATAGPEGDANATSGAAWGDYDNDGDLDLFITNHLAPDKLLRNDGVAGFTDVTPASLDGPTEGLSVAWGDYDNDGDLDLYLGRVVGVANQLMRNDGGGAFTDVTSGPLGETEEATSVIWGDYDNDGDLDLYLPVTNGQNKLLRNDGSGNFTDATDPALADPEFSIGAAWGDYDNDGDLDIYQANSAGPNRLFRNGLNNGNHWLQIDLVGTVSNAAGIGARVRVVSGGVSQIREISGGSGYTSQGSLTAEFGLGSAVIADSVRVYWPSGVVQDTVAVAVDQRITLTEPDDSDPCGSLPDLSSKVQDFEAFIPSDAQALADDDWLVWGNVFDPTGTTYLYGYGGPAPNDSSNPAFCLIATGEGGPHQGAQQIVVFSDYINPEHGSGAGNLIESNVLQEQAIGPGDIGKTWAFEFDAKRGDLAGTTTAEAFIKTLDPAAGDYQTNLVTVDMTTIPATWNTYLLSLHIDDPSLCGQKLQYGFRNTTANYGLSGVFYDNVYFGMISTTDVGEFPNPGRHLLLPASPNPFNPRTTLVFNLPKQEIVSLRIFDVAGRLVDVLLDDELAAAGRNEVVWRGRDRYGRAVPAGVYFYRLNAGAFSDTKRMVLLK